MHIKILVNLYSTVLSLSNQYLQVSQMTFKSMFKSHSAIFISATTNSEKCFIDFLHYRVQGGTDKLTETQYINCTKPELQPANAPGTKHGMTRIQFTKGFS